MADVQANSPGADDREGTSQQRRIRTVYRNPKTLKENPENAKKHPRAQIDALAANLRELGFINPVLIDDDSMIRAGHARVRAAMQIGLDSIPCIKAAWLTPEQIRRFEIADNQLAEMGSWDRDKLREALQPIRLEGVDLAELGFSATSIASLFPAGGGKAGGGGVSDAAASKATTFQIPVDKLDRVRQAVDRCRAIDGQVTTNGAAIAAICEHYLATIGRGGDEGAEA